MFELSFWLFRVYFKSEKLNKILQLTFKLLISTKVISIEF